MRVAFEVTGKPQPAGSKRAFTTKTGRTVVTDDNPNSKPWQAIVADAGLTAMLADSDTLPPLLEGPLGLAVVFSFIRPKGHFGTGRNAGAVKDSAPEWPTVKPDATKLLRGLEDALTGVVWRDDAQVVEQAVTKRYAEREGARVIVWTL